MPHGWLSHVKQCLRASHFLAKQPQGGLTGKRHNKLSPIIAGSLVFIVAGARGNFSIKQAARFKRMLAQEAVTKAVNGKNSRFVHPFRSGFRAEERRVGNAKGETS